MKRRIAILITGFVSLVLITFLTVTYITDRASASVAGNQKPQPPYPVLVIEASTGVHGSIWKFWDNNRECYFNSSGGIWCTP